LRVRFQNPDQPDSVTEQDWDDSWFLSLGSSYRPSENWVLRAGVAYDQSPVPDGTRNPRIPDADRYWVSLGATWQLDHWLELNAGYSHIFMSDSKTDLTLSDPDNQTRGALSADYESDIDIFSISLSLKF
jgi:long-chain fatty acid transport protein